MVLGLLIFFSKGRNIGRLLLFFVIHFFALRRRSRTNMPSQKDGWIPATGLPRPPDPFFFF